MRTYPHGVPSWLDVVVPDLDEAKRFYAALFDWTFTDAMPPDAPGNYLIATIGGHDVAAIGSADDGPEGVWRTYIAVDDADATAKQVEGEGGAVTLAPVDAGPGGRRAVCVDPRGAEFSLWQARKRPGAQLVNAPGAWGFSDLQTTDPHAAATFYTKLFGWEVDDIGFDATLVRKPGYGDHLSATVNPDIRERQAGFAPPGFEDAVAWMKIVPEGHSERWQASFTVADRDASVELADGVGGEVVETEEAEFTRSATIRDSQGAEFVVSQFTPPKG